MDTFVLSEAACALDDKKVGFGVHFCILVFILQPRRRDTRFPIFGLVAEPVVLSVISGGVLMRLISRGLHAVALASFSFVRSRNLR